MRQEYLAGLNIEIVGTLPWSKLMDLLREARVLVAPGHFQETYNLLTVEAAACGVPTVSMGIGALRERVVHEESGWIASSVKEMGSALARVLVDDDLWGRYHRACLHHRDLVSWDDRAGEWEDRISKFNVPPTTGRHRSRTLAFQNCRSARYRSARLETNRPLRPSEASLRQDGPSSQRRSDT